MIEEREAIKKKKAKVKAQEEKFKKRSQGCQKLSTFFESKWTAPHYYTTNLMITYNNWIKAISQKSIKKQLCLLCFNFWCLRPLDFRWLQRCQFEILFCWSVFVPCSLSSCLCCVTEVVASCFILSGKCPSLCFVSSLGKFPTICRHSVCIFA